MSTETPEPAFRRVDPRQSDAGFFGAHWKAIAIVFVVWFGLNAMRIMAAESGASLVGGLIGAAAGSAVASVVVVLVGVGIWRLGGRVKSLL